MGCEPCTVDLKEPFLPKGQVFVTAIRQITYVLLFLFLTIHTAFIKTIYLESTPCISVMKKSITLNQPILEHNPRIESEENSECLWEHSKKTNEVLWPQFLWNTRLFWECPHVLPRSMDRSEFTSNCSFLLVVVIQLNVFLYMSLWHVFVMCGSSMWLYTAWNHETFTHVIFLNPRVYTVWGSTWSWLLCKTLVRLIYLLHSLRPHHFYSGDEGESC